MPSYAVTGANRGLGYAFVKHLASIEGNTVIALARIKSATEERLAKDGVKGVHVFAADITDAKALKAAAEGTAQVTGGKLDVLINNAGLVSKKFAFSTLIDGTPEDLEEDLMTSFKANAVGPVQTINAFLPLIRKGDVKKVVVLSTGMADLDFTNDFSIPIAGPYAISKAATNMVVAKYNAALKSEGVLFMAISPGFVDTSEGVAPSEEEMAGIQAMGGMFAGYAPDFKGPISSEESVKMQLDVIDKASVETSGGAFVSHFGNKQWL